MLCYFSTVYTVFISRVDKLAQMNPGIRQNHVNAANFKRKSSWFIMKDVIILRQRLPTNIIIIEENRRWRK